MTAEVPFRDRYTPDVLRANHESAIRSAEIVVPLLLATLPGLRSVVDVGCGLGTWLAEFTRRGVWDVLGIDGPWVDRDCFVVPGNRFAPRDLREDLDPIPAFTDGFDLCLCLEVAEHLPPESAETLIRSLCSLAPTVFFSAAYPGQGGHYHVNEQPPEYWVERFARYGYRPRELPGLAEAGDEVHVWYRNGRLFEQRP